MKKFGTPAKYLHRTEGPETSEHAAHSIDTTVLESLIFEEISASGRRGCTQDDLLDRFKHLRYSSVTARPSALERKGLIVRGPDKRQGHSGRNQFVMRAKL